MPATRKGNAPLLHVLGVDGCKAGWLAVKAFPKKGNLIHYEAHLFGTLKQLMAQDGWGKQSALTVIDMPIGLADFGRRECDRLARAYLGKGRSSSIFAAPRRPMLAMDDYAQANQWGKAQAPVGGGGLSKQAWHLIPKIREVDAVITPALQKILREGHPEIAFTRLNDGVALVASKKTEPGFKQRTELLARSGLIDIEISTTEFCQTHRGQLLRDDYLDASALALTALAVLQNEHVRFSTGKKDMRNLVMEIIG